MVNKRAENSFPGLHVIGNLRKIVSLNTYLQMEERYKDLGFSPPITFLSATYL